MIELKRTNEWYKHHKEKRFREYIRQFRKETVKKLRDLQKSKWYILKDYQRICRKFTELTIKHEKINIDGRHFIGIHIDHILPVWHAWKMKLSPYLIGMSANLQRLPEKQNRAKGRHQRLLK